MFTWSACLLEVLCWFFPCAEFPHPKLFLGDTRGTTSLPIKKFESTGLIQVIGLNQVIGLIQDFGLIQVIGLIQVFWPYPRFWAYPGHWTYPDYWTYSGYWTYLGYWTYPGGLQPALAHGKVWARAGPGPSGLKWAQTLPQPR